MRGLRFAAFKADADDIAATDDVERSIINILMMPVLSLPNWEDNVLLLGVSVKFV